RRLRRGHLLVRQPGVVGVVPVPAQDVRGQPAGGTAVGLRRGREPGRGRDRDRPDDRRPDGEGGRRGPGRDVLRAGGGGERGRVRGRPVLAGGGPGHGKCVVRRHVHPGRGHERRGGGRDRAHLDPDRAVVHR